MKIAIETETPDDPTSMFRVLLDDKLIGEGLTAVQAQLVVAEIIERIVLGKSPGREAPQRKIAAIAMGMIRRG